MHKQSNTRVAKTLTALAEGTDAVANRINNRSIMLTEAFVADVLSLVQIGYPGRRPRSLADKKGRARPTDMDLASFLWHQIATRTVVELPTYSGVLPKKEEVGINHTTERRFGEILSLSSHQSFFSFGVTIQDMSIVARDNVTEADSVGRPRTFLIVDHSGKWHGGWQGLAWRYRQNEKEFRDRYELTDDKLHRQYQYFAHPNRRQSYASRPYLLLKLLLLRLYEERVHFGTSYTEDTDGKQLESMGPARYQLVPAFHMRLEGIARTGEYPSQTSLEEAALAAYRELLATAKHRVQFLVRLNEYAFFKYGLETNYLAPWVRGDVWHVRQGSHDESGYIDLAPGLRLRYTSKQVGLAVRA